MSKGNSGPVQRRHVTDNVTALVPKDDNTVGPRRKKYETLFFATREAAEFRDLIDAIARLGSLVRECRRAQNLTQVELAARSGVSRSAIAEIEAGVIPDGPRFGTVFKLVHACGRQLAVNASGYAMMEFGNDHLAAERVGTDD